MNFTPTEKQVAAGARIIASSPLIDAPKLTAVSWRGLARAVIEAALKAEPFNQKWRRLSAKQKQRVRDKAEWEHMSLSAVMSEWPSIIDDIK